MVSTIKDITVYEVDGMYFDTYEEALAYQTKIEEEKLVNTRPAWLSYRDWKMCWSDVQHVRIINFGAYDGCKYINEQGKRSEAERCLFTRSDSDAEKRLLELIVGVLNSSKEIVKFHCHGYISNLDMFYEYIGALKRSIKKLQSDPEIGIISDTAYDVDCKWCHGTGWVEVITKYYGEERQMECDCNKER